MPGAATLTVWLYDSAMGAAAAEVRLKVLQQQGALTVTVQPATSPYVIQLNTKAAPFNDVRARQAIYAATDFDSIAKGVFKGLYPVSQDFTGPGGLFHQDRVDGYPPFDLEKAKQLVQQYVAGGGSATVVYKTTNAPNRVAFAEFLQAQMAAIGHPLLGDDKYGDREFNKRMKARRLMLCAVELRFELEGEWAWLNDLRLSISPDF